MYDGLAAREIHDTIAQGLAGIITQLQAAERARPQPERHEWHLGQARESLTAARRSVAALRPVELEEAQLPNAIRDLARRWSAREGVPASVETTGDPVPLLTEIEVALFRAAQEALANIAKHAAAGKVRLTISYLEDTVMLDVHDDGVGFTVADLDGPPPADRDSGYGLDSLRRRLDRALGTLTVESAPGSGTAVNASVPAIRRGGSA